MRKAIAGFLGVLASIAAILGLLIALNIVHPFPAPVTPTPDSKVTNFAGTWHNVDDHTQSWAKIEIRVDRNTLFVQFVGKCSGNPCDTGILEGPAGVNPFFLHTDDASATRDFTLTLEGIGDTLHVSTSVHFKSASDGPDYTSEDDFHR